MRKEEDKPTIWPYYKFSAIWPTSGTAKGKEMYRDSIVGRKELSKCNNVN